MSFRGGGGRGRGRGRGRGSKFAHIPGASADFAPSWASGPAAAAASGDGGSVMSSIARVPELYPPLALNPPLEPTGDEDELLAIHQMLLQDMQQSPYYLQLKRKEKLAIPAVPRFSDRARKLASSTKRPMLGSLGLDANFFPPELQPVVDPSLRSTVQAGRKRKRRAMADAAELALAMGEISDDDDAVAKPRGGNADGSDDEEADPMDQDDDWEDDEDGDDDYNAEKYYDEDRDDDAEEGRGGGDDF